MQRVSRFFVGIFLLIATLMLSACGSAATPTPLPEIPVDGLFKEYYQSLGGRDALGPAGCKAFEFKGMTCQYTSNALMCHDPFAVEITQRFKLYPLGLALNLHDEPDAPDGASDGRVLNGYLLYPAFGPRFDAIKGEQTTGRALTRARYNYLQRRIEQYFENVGFFQSLDDPSGRVCLLAYGSYACRESCQQPPEEACLGLLNPSQGSVEQPFLEGLAGSNLLVIGQPVSRPYTGDDGQLRQVYEAALVASSDGGGLRLLPLPGMLNLPSEEPAAPSGTSSSQHIFYPTRDGLGFYVLTVFDQYIQEHGGPQYSGLPTGNVQSLEHGVQRQCFENYCLEYTPAAAPAMRVRMTALGIQYLQTNPIDGSLVTGPLYSSETIEMQASAAHASVRSDAAQEILIQINDRQSGQPLMGVGASLRLTLPDTNEINLNFPLTDAQGRASLTLDPLPNMENGGIIPYHVCLNLSSPQPICVSQSYMVWNYR